MLKNQTPQPLPDQWPASATDRQTGATIWTAVLHLHARWRLTSQSRCKPAKRGSVCEAFEKKPLPLALTLLLRYRYRPLLAQGYALLAYTLRVTNAFCAKIVSDNRWISSIMKCCDGYINTGWVRECVRDVFAIYDNNISPGLLMIIIKIIILYFIQIRHTDDFPPTGTPASRT